MGTTHETVKSVIRIVESYQTSLGRAPGWREHKASGDCVIDVPSNEIIARGLCMPHSPRVHADRLWLLDSGTGQLLTVDSSTGTTQIIVALPGYARGLSFFDRFAFVALSKIRESAMFGGLPITEKENELKCGVWVVDTSTGRIVASLEFVNGIEEIFDVKLLEGMHYPAVVGLQKETIHGTFFVPT